MALVVSEPFAHDPFDSVALHSTPEPLLDHEAKAMMFQGVRNEVQTKMGSFRAFSRFLDPLKIGGNANSFVRPERVVAPQRDSSSIRFRRLTALDRKALSALCTTTFEYRAATFCRHAFEEAVGAFSFKVAWLESSFGHGKTLLFKLNLHPDVRHTTKATQRSCEMPESWRWIEKIIDNLKCA